MPGADEDIQRTLGRLLNAAEASERQRAGMDVTLQDISRRLGPIEAMVTQVREHGGLVRREEFTEIQGAVEELNTHARQMDPVNGWPSRTDGRLNATENELRLLIRLRERFYGILVGVALVSAVIGGGSGAVAKLVLDTMYKGSGHYGDGTPRAQQ